MNKNILKIINTSNVSLNPITAKFRIIAKDNIDLRSTFVFGRNLPNREAWLRNPWERDSAKFVW